MDISPIESVDLPALADLYQQLIPNKISISKMKLVLEKNKNNSNHLVLGAKIDGKLVGTLLSSIGEMLFGQCKSFMVIEDVVVDRAHRRKRIGNALMRYVEDFSKQNNCSYIMLITDRERIGPQQFYKSLGYDTDGYCAFKKKIKL